MNEILKLIDVIKKVHDSEYIEITGDIADSVFQYRYCYYFAELLQKFYPDGEFYMKNDASHVALKIGDYLYDSLGALSTSGFHPFEEEDWLVVEISMLPRYKIERDKMNNFVNDIYEKIKLEYLNSNNNMKKQV